MDKNSALQQVISKMNILGSMIRGASQQQQKFISPVIDEPMPDVNNKRAMQMASNQRFNPAPKVDTSYATPAWIHQQQLNALKLSGSKEPNGTWSALSPEGRKRVLAPAPVVRDPNHMSGMQPIPNSYPGQVQKKPIPLGRGIVTPTPLKSNEQNILQQFQAFFGGGNAPAKKTLRPSPTPTVRPTATPTPNYPLPTTTPYPSPTPIPGAGSTTKNEHTENFIKKVIVPMAQRYDVDPGIVAGQFANEGRLGGVGAERNNFFNIGVTDAIVEAAKQSGDWSQVPGYNSPEGGVERYLMFISGTGPDSMYANGVDGSASGKVGKKQFAEAWAKYRHNPPAFLKAIGPTYASSGEMYATNTMNTPEYQNYTNYR